MIARARDLLRAYFAAQLLMAFGAVCFLGGLAVGCVMAIRLVRHFAA